MKDVVQSGPTLGQQRKAGWFERLATTVAPPLALIMYLIMLEQCGFPFLNLNCDEQVIEAALNALDSTS
jgi:hypothetical protein